MKDSNTHTSPALDVAILTFFGILMIVEFALKNYFYALVWLLLLISGIALYRQYYPKGKLQKFNKENALPIIGIILGLVIILLRIILIVFGVQR